MKFYKIVPLSYIGKGNDYLTYSSNADTVFEPGDAVLIPMRKGKIIGIVAVETTEPDFKTKEIIEKIFETSVLSNDLFKLGKWISDYYLCPLSTTFSSMIPSGITKKRRAIDQKMFEKSEKSYQLNNEQKKAYNSISKNLLERPHLLFGVTGSGKTEIYMHLIEDQLAEGKGAIVLVPEISLTPQTVERFQKRFGDLVTVLHSDLKETERYANWKSLLDGKKRIVVGSRSAIFAPIKNLGIIVIDEEHDPSYKQENNPRYDAISVAQKRCEFEKAGLVLGSATPRIESFYKAQTGSYNLHTLSNRIVQTNLPKVVIADMRHEFKYGNFSIFSEKLQKEIKETLAKKMQVLLFINRRGMSTFVSCRDCGHVEICPNCNLSLTFHYEDLKLECHHCGFKKSAPSICPECKSLAIKYFGTGTQKVEQEAIKMFGDKVKIARMDADTTKTRDSHNDIYNDFKNKKLDILIGTQMITKGWDLENVGLVGIISADTAINFPDFTAAERTFSLLTQVAGRTGRGKDAGSVIIQTYNPEHFAIKFAKNHDYAGFYTEELENRSELYYPPFAKLVKLLYNNSVQEVAKTEVAEKAQVIRKIFEDSGVKFSLLGPSPAFIPKINHKYFYQLTVKITKISEPKLIKVMKEINEILDENWSIDIDPKDLL